MRRDSCHRREFSANSAAVHELPRDQSGNDPTKIVSDLL